MEHEAPGVPKAEEQSVEEAHAELTRFLDQQNDVVRSFRRGEVIDGTVVRVDKDELLVDIGSKSEGIIPSRVMQVRKVI